MTFVIYLKDGNPFVILNDTLYHLVLLKTGLVEQLVEVDEMVRETFDELVISLNTYYHTDEINNALARVEVYD